MKYKHLEIWKCQDNSFWLISCYRFKSVHGQPGPKLENSLGPKSLPVRCIYQGSLFIFFFTGAQSIASADLWSQMNCALSVDFHDE